MTSNPADIQLPTEIWDDIAQYVWAPEDLLRLALVNSRLRDIVIPDHLNYSKIWTDNCNVALWEGLNAKSAGRVRELWVDCVAVDDNSSRGWVVRSGVGDFERPGIPCCIRRDISEDIDYDCLCKYCRIDADLTWLRPMRESISTMGGLGKLVLSFFPCQLFAIYRDGLFQSFGTTLDDLEIHMLQCRNYDPDAVENHLDFVAVREAICHLRGGYSRFSFHWTVLWDDDESTSMFDAVARFLIKRCPDLRTLELSAGPLKEDRDFLAVICSDLVEGRRPLETLSLRGVLLPCIEMADLPEDIKLDPTTEFSRAHSGLKSLRMTGGSLLLDPSLFTTTLPELRTLHLDRYNLYPYPIFLGLFESPDNPNDKRTRPIESISMRLDDNLVGVGLPLIAAVDGMCCHGSVSGTIRKLDCSFPRYMDKHPYLLRWIGQSNPLISELTAGPQSEDTFLDTQSAAWQELLYWFPNLEVLRSEIGTFWLKSSSNSKEADVKECLKRLPKLRQVEGWVRRSECMWRNEETREEIEVEV